MYYQYALSHPLRNVLVAAAMLILAGFTVASSQAAEQNVKQQNKLQQKSAQQQKQQKTDNADRSANMDKSANKNQSTSMHQSKNTAAGAASDMLLKKQQDSQILGSSIRGMTVKNGTGDKAQTIGTIRDVVLNKNHKLVGILVGVGGFLGVAETNYGFVWDAVKVNNAADVAVIHITHKQLDNASPYMTLHEQKQKKKRKKQKRQQQKRMKQKAQQQQSSSMGSSG